MKELLKRLIAGGTNLTRTETHDALIGITQEKYPTEQVVALLTAIQMKGITDDELLGLRDAMLETGVSVDLAPYRPIDIVGTGGDGKNTFNISTCACFVVAGAGYHVAKHGNHAATGVSGASTVLALHGVNFSADSDHLRRSIEASGVAYMHAPLFATAMKYVAPIRKALAIPTCFNLLGPIINPCRNLAYQLLGTANLSQMRLYSNALQQTSITYGIVNSTDGYDEISLTGPFKTLTATAERILSPAQVGMPRVNPEDLYGGTTPEEAMKIFDSVLEGTATESQTNAVAINAAFAIQIMRPELELEECLDQARESIRSGKALACLKKFIEINH